jgi:hypothetical protein
MFLTVKLAFIEALELAFDLGDTARIEELLGMIEELRPGERPPLLEAHRLYCRSKLIGDEAGFKAAAAAFRALEMPFWFARVLLDHGGLLREQGHADEAGWLLAEAAAIFEGLRAWPWIERAAGSGAELVG